MRRLQWVAHLEFSHNKEVSDLTWDKVEVRLPHTDKLRSMILNGIPHSLRPQLWLRMSGTSLNVFKIFLLTYYMYRGITKETSFRTEL